MSEPTVGEVLGMLAAQHEERTCKVCGEVKLLERFTKTNSVNKRGEQGRLHTCQDCRNASQKSEYHSDPRKRALQIARSMNAGSRVKHLPKVDPYVVADLILSATACAYCGQPNDGSVGFAIDHEVPLSLGGDHALSNLKICCERCNRAKHDVPPDEYRRWLYGVISRAKTVSLTQ